MFHYIPARNIAACLLENTIVACPKVFGPFEKSEVLRKMLQKYSLIRGDTLDDIIGLSEGSFTLILNSKALFGIDYDFFNSNFSTIQLYTSTNIRTLPRSMSHWWELAAYPRQPSDDQTLGKHSNMRDVYITPLAA